MKGAGAILRCVVAASFHSSAAFHFSTAGDRVTRRGGSLSMTARPGKDKDGNLVYCGDRNPAMGFFRDAVGGGAKTGVSGDPAKLAVARRAAGGTAAAPAASKKAQDGGSKFSPAYIGKASFLTLPFVYMAYEYFSKYG